jgi:hypothetical protein
VQPTQLQLGMAVVKETEAARVARQQAVAAGMAPPGVELDVETVNAALQVAIFRLHGHGTRWAAPPVPHAMLRAQPGPAARVWACPTVVLMPCCRKPWRSG